MAAASSGICPEPGDYLVTERLEREKRTAVMACFLTGPKKEIFTVAPSDILNKTEYTESKVEEDIFWMEGKEKSEICISCAQLPDGTAIPIFLDWNSEEYRYKPCPWFLTEDEQPVYRVREKDGQFEAEVENESLKAPNGTLLAAIPGPHVSGIRCPFVVTGDKSVALLEFFLENMCYLLDFQLELSQEFRRHKAKITVERARQPLQEAGELPIVEGGDMEVRGKAICQPGITVTRENQEEDAETKGQSQHQEPSDQDPDHEEQLSIDQYKHCQAFKVGREGGRLINKSCGVLLDVPEGALEEEIILYIGKTIARSKTDKGLKDGNQLSKAILCGPHDIRFKVPVYLTFGHSWVPLDKESSLPSVYTSRSADVSHPNWEKIEKALFSSRHVNLELNHFSEFIVVGEQIGRLMTVMAFCKRCGTAINVNIAVIDLDEVQPPFTVAVNELQEPGSVSHHSAIIENIKSEAFNVHIDVKYNGKSYFIERRVQIRLPSGTNIARTILSQEAPNANHTAKCVAIQSEMSKASNNQKLEEQGAQGVTHPEEPPVTHLKAMHLQATQAKAAIANDDQACLPNAFAIPADLIYILDKNARPEDLDKLSDGIFEIRDKSFQPGLKQMLHFWSASFEDNTPAALLRLVRTIGATGLADIIDKWLNENSGRRKKQFTN